MAENVITQNAEGETTVYENVSGVELYNDSGGTATFIHDAEILNPDWNQGNENKKDYIKNKPFGDVPEVLPAADYAFAEDLEIGGLFYCEVEDTPEMLEGESYTVTWDGTAYTCICEKDKVAGSITLEGYSLGNSTIFWNLGQGEDTGEPFIVLRQGDNVVINTLSTEATHSISIAPVNAVKKLDKKYLPDDIGGGGSGLPEVTAGDNGKFLGVVNGAWEKVDAPEGGGGGSQTVIMEEKTVEGFEDDGGLFAAYTEGLDFTVTTGETYTVVWDGTEYETVAKDFTADGITLTVLGNLAVAGMGEDSGEPFFMYSMPAGTIPTEQYDTTQYLTTISGTSHTIGIYQGTDASEVSWNDLTDKPFGEETATIFEGEFQDELYDPDGDGTADEWNGQIFVEDSSDTTLVVGQTYTVIWDGTTYETECVEVEGLPAIGNTGLMMETGDTGEPFIIARDATGGEFSETPTWMAIILEPPDITASGLYSCKITTGGIKYLDNKYLDFMTSSPETEILQEQTLTFALTRENSGEPEKSIFFWNAEMETQYALFYPITPGAKVGVMFDGTEYNLTAVDLSSTFEAQGATVNKAFCIGNAAMFNAGADTGEPFGIFVLDATLGTTAINQAMFGAYHTSADASFDCVVSVTQLATSVIKKEYLPDDIGGGSGLPDVTSDDNGKVLGVVGGAWAVASGLPSVTTDDNDKVLKVSDGAWAVVSETQELPAVTASDAGKFLRVDSNGNWIAETVLNAEEVSF